MFPGYMTVAEAAVELGLTHQQVLNRIHRKTIKARKAGWQWLLRKTTVEAEKKRLAEKNQLEPTELK